jgi:hypothetical protein
MKVKVCKKWYPISLFKQAINHKRCYRRYGYINLRAGKVESIVIITYSGAEYSVSPKFGIRLLREDD